MFFIQSKIARQSVKLALCFVAFASICLQPSPAQTRAVSTTTTTTGDFYVSPQGNDTWPGTLARPFATVDRARAAVRLVKSKITNRPITVLLRAGTYYLPSTLTFTSADSGSSSAPIVYANYGGETPLISGGRPVGGWVQNSDGSWETNAPAKVYFTQLWRNGVRLARPRTTPNSYLYILGPHVSAQNRLASDGLYYHNAAPGGVPASMANLSDVELVDFAFWDVARMRIASVNTASQLILTTRSLSQQDTFHGFLPGHRFLLENVKEALNQPGEWYLDRSTWKIKYLPRSGELISQSRFVAPHLAKILTATSLSHVTFSGLTFAHNDYQISSSGYVSGQAANSTSAAISLVNANTVLFQNCNVQHTGDYGIEFTGASTSSVFRDGSIRDTGAGGMRVGTLANCSSYPDTQGSVPHNISIINNLIAATGRVFPEAFSVMIGNAHNMVVQNNEIMDAYATAIGVGFNWNYTCNLAHDNLVQFNNIHDIGQGVTSDIGGVYLLTGANTGNKILNNKVHDVINDPGGYGGWGLYLDNGSSQVLLQNNLVYRTTGEGFHLNISAFSPPNPAPTPNLILNNVLVLGGEGVVDRHNDSTYLTWVAKNNIIYYDRAQPQFGYWNCRGLQSCTGFFQFDDNLYYDVSAAGGEPAKPFMTTSPAGANSGRQPPFTLITMAQWKALGEDTNSFFANPLFKNPTRGVDDYSLQANSPAFGLGFKAFDASQADRLPGFRSTVPLAPAAFPVQVRSAPF